MPNARKKSAYTKKDLREVSDNPATDKGGFREGPAIL